MGDRWLAVRSLVWTLAFPGVFALWVPWRYFGFNRVPTAFGPVTLLGLLSIAAGIALLAACIVEFARRGRGTLSPVDPPRHLVTRSAYQYVRNPMYLGVSMIILGEVMVTGSRPLAVYWLIWFICVNLFVIGYEEPNLRDRFGASYDEYTRRVGRWIPRRARIAPRKGASV